MDKREIFVAVVDHGGFTAAAKALGVSTSYASRCVRQLESELGVLLLARSTRAVQPTEAGRAYHARLSPLFQGLAEADLTVRSGVAEPQGRLAVALPHAFGRRWVLPSLLRFQQRWPAVEVELTLSDRLTDPLAVDVTIRGGRLRDSSLVARRVLRTTDVLVASPRLLADRGRPADPAALQDWPAARYTGHRETHQWTLRRGDETATAPVRGVFFADSGEAVVAAAEAGLGLALQPAFLVGAALAAGRLERVLPAWTARSLDFWALTPSRMVPATVRAFLDILTADLAARPWLPPAGA